MRWMRARGGLQSPLLHPGSTHALFCGLHADPPVLVWTDRLRQVRFYC